MVDSSLFMNVILTWKVGSYIQQKVKFPSAYTLEWGVSIFLAVKSKHVTKLHLFPFPDQYILKMLFYAEFNSKR
jgi:hypothetical protein